MQFRQEEHQLGDLDPQQFAVGITSNPSNKRKRKKASMKPTYLKLVQANEFLTESIIFIV